MKLTYVPAGLGWRRDLPDIRDLTPEHPQVLALLKSLKPARRRKMPPRQVDLREFFPDAADQGPLNASTAYACVALVEYFQRRTLGMIREHSPLFLYKVTRQLLNVAGDTGADLRSTLKALVQFGLPPQKFGPQSFADFDREPSAFEFGFLGTLSSIRYLRLDAQNSTGEETLSVIKSFLAAGLPMVFGYSVPTSLSWESDIPYRPAHDAPRGGMAAVAVGYDDSHIRSTKGALLIRNSWGPEWGEASYGWLPYAYVEQQLAVDFWTMLSKEWVSSGEFRRPHTETARVSTS